MPSYSAIGRTQQHTTDNQYLPKSLLATAQHKDGKNKRAKIESAGREFAARVQTGGPSRGAHVDHVDHVSNLSLKTLKRKSPRLSSLATP